MVVFETVFAFTWVSILFLCANKTSNNMWQRKAKHVNFGNMTWCWIESLKQSIQFQCSAPVPKESVPDSSNGLPVNRGNRLLHTSIRGKKMIGITFTHTRLFVTKNNLLTIKCYLYTAEKFRLSKILSQLRSLLFVEPLCFTL